MRTQVSFHYGDRIVNEFTSSKNTRRRRNKSGSKLKDDAKNVEKIEERAKNTDSSLQCSIQIKTFLFTDNHWNVKEKRVHRNCQHTCDYKDFVPFLKHRPLWIKNFSLRRIQLLCLSFTYRVNQWRRSSEFLHLLWSTHKASSNTLQNSAYTWSLFSFVYGVFLLYTKRWLWSPILKPGMKRDIPNLVINLKFLTIQLRKTKKKAYYIILVYADLSNLTSQI